MCVQWVTAGVEVVGLLCFNSQGQEVFKENGRFMWGITYESLIWKPVCTLNIRTFKYQLNYVIVSYSLTIVYWYIKLRYFNNYWHLATPLKGDLDIKYVGANFMCMPKPFLI